MSLRKLQELAGIEPDGLFGPKSFKAGADYLGITDHDCAVHFFAQTGHESANFKVYTENLNYSAIGLRRTFSKYFLDQEVAEKFAHKPEQIANRVYASRMGNGIFESGEGWKFRGRGALQLTGRNNYQAFSDSIDDPDVMVAPATLAGKYSFTSAVFFFETNRIWDICKEGLSEDTIKQVTKKINGGLNGLDDRIRLTDKYSGYQL